MTDATLGTPIIGTVADAPQGILARLCRQSSATRWLSQGFDRGPLRHRRDRRPGHRSRSARADRPRQPPPIGRALVRHGRPRTTTCSPVARRGDRVTAGRGRQRRPRPPHRSAERHARRLLRDHMGGRGRRPRRQHHPGAAVFILGLVVLGFTGAGPINVLGLELPPVTKSDRADRGRGRSDVRPRGACQRVDRTPGGLRRPRSESSASGGGGSCSATSSSTSFPQSSYKPRRGWRWRCSPRPVSASSVSVSSLLSRPSGTSCSRRRARSCSVTGGSRMFAGLLIFTVIAGFNLIGDGIGRAFGRDTGA